MLNIRINVPHLSLVVNKEKAVKKNEKKKKKEIRRTRNVGRYFVITQ